MKKFLMSTVSHIAIARALPVSKEAQGWIIVKVGHALGLIKITERTDA